VMERLHDDIYVTPKVLVFAINPRVLEAVAVLAVEIPGAGISSSQGQDQGVEDGVWTGRGSWSSVLGKEQLHGGWGEYTEDGF